MEKQTNKTKCENEFKQELGFRDNHPLVLCIRCLRFVDRNRFGLSIYNKEKLRICSKCCNEEKYMRDKDWVEDLIQMREENQLIIDGVEE